MEYDQAISFANWDIFWYTRGFPSMDTERMRRNASKLLTYPMTVASVLHQNSGLTLSNQRVTPEGIRSLTGTHHFVLVQFTEVFTDLCTASYSLYSTRPTRVSGDRGGRRWKARLPRLHCRGARRVLSTAARLGAAQPAVPLGVAPGTLHRSAGFTPKERGYGETAV